MQGLLGISDFANLVFFQEKSIWLIRFIQAIPIYFLLKLFLNRGTNKFLILIFLTAPIFTQWLTIGKYLFLPDVSITIAYLVWERYKEQSNLINLLVLMILSLAFKITCIIISLPIIFHLIFYYFYIKKSINFKSNFLQYKYYLILFSLVPLVIIIIYRFYLTGNFFLSVI